MERDERVHIVKLCMSPARFEKRYVDMTNVDEES